MKIYVATSWRNRYQPEVVQRLRGEGYDVYDFRNPAPSQCGFAWEEIDSGWRQWSVADYSRALIHPAAAIGFRRDFEALAECEVCVLLLPSGASAHLEAGWCAGQGKRVLVFAPVLPEPELMYKLFDSEEGSSILESLDDLVVRLQELGSRK